MSILDEICRNTIKEVAERERRCSVDQMRSACAAAKPPRGFRNALVDAAGVALIAEIKKASPSAGVIRGDFDPVCIARDYEAGGATALSVLTDTRYFQGSLEYLKAVREAVALPLLRKDFTLTPYQVYEARAAGADAVLLIVACLEDDLLAELKALSESLGMDALVEVHDEEEVERALACGAGLVGVNNRNLKDFSVDLATTRRIGSMLPAGVVLVSESGIKSRQDVVRAGAYGARAVLVGECLMRRDDIRAATRELAGERPEERD